jgi:hypothetical protein
MHLVKWSDLGFPKEEGHYHLAGMDILVKKSNIRRADEWLALGNDDAVFELLIIPQVSGPAKFILGALQG